MLHKLKRYLDILIKGKYYYPLIAPPPAYATILMESRCTNRCIYCVNHSLDSKKNDLTKAIYNKRLTLDWENFKKIVDKLINDGIKKIHLCGSGEPFFNSLMLDFVDYVIKQDIPVSFQTNFGKVARPFLPEIATRKIEYIATDIVGGTKESFEKIKIGSNWDFLFESIDELEKHLVAHKNHIPIHGYVVINKNSCDYIDELIRKCSKHNIINELFFNNIHAFGFNEFVSINNIITTQDEEVINKINNAVVLGERYGIKVRAPAYLDNKNRFNCKNFWGRVMINFPTERLPEENWVGNVMPGGCLCATMGNYYSIGNILKMEFAEIWNGEKMIRARQMALNNEFPDEYCKICPAHYKPDI